MTDRDVLERLLKSLTLADHMGDVFEYMKRACELAEIPWPEECYDMEDLGQAWHEKPGLWGE